VKQTETKNYDRANKDSTEHRVEVIMQ